jgi:hypothetical protein
VHEFSVPTVIEPANLGKPTSATHYFLTVCENSIVYTLKLGLEFGLHHHGGSRAPLVWCAAPGCNRIHPRGVSETGLTRPVFVLKEPLRLP